MFKINKKLFLLIIFEMVILIKAKETTKREFGGYLTPEEDKKWDYHGFQYPGYFYPMKEECEKNPMLPLLGKGVNFLLLKLGVFGVIKAFLTLIFLGFLAKLPLIFLKFAFLKSFFLPFFLAPLLLNLLSNQMSPSSESGLENKPSDLKPSENEEGIGMGDMSMSDMGMGRSLEMTKNFSSVAWQSVKMFAESDQCVERISCLIGASNTDSSVGKMFYRILKLLHYSSPPAVQERMAIIKDAFTKGSRTLTCTDNEYKCESPQLLIQHGLTKVKLL